jgi:hypothetical protein
MVARSYARGHAVWHDGERWVYVDTGEPMSNSRPCARCGRPPLSGDEDACLGHLDGVVGACCGHGVGPGYVILEGTIVVREDTNA